MYILRLKINYRFMLSCKSCGLKYAQLLSPLLCGKYIMKYLISIVWCGPKNEDGLCSQVLNSSFHFAGTLPCGAETTDYPRIIFHSTLKVYLGSNKTPQTRLSTFLAGGDGLSNFCRNHWMKLLGKHLKIRVRAGFYVLYAPSCQSCLASGCDGRRELKQTFWTKPKS